MFFKKKSKITEFEQAKQEHISSTELYKIKEAQVLNDYDFKYPFRKVSFWFWREKFREKKQKTKTFLILMQLRNGMMKQFRVSTWKPYFEWNKGAYIIDPDMAREDSHSGLNCLYYHQDISIPFKIEFKVEDIHKEVLKTKLSDKEYNVDKALNPSNLKEFIISEVIEKILKGEALVKALRIIKIITIIILIIVILEFFFILKSSGVV